MMIVGIPIYVCATASVPLAASFIFLGASPGAALAFLIAGPATNAATLTTIGKVLGKRTMLIYLLTVAGSAFGGGLLLDWLMPRAAEAIPLLSGTGHHHEGVGWFEHLSAAALVVIMTRSWWMGRRRGSCCDEGACGTTEAPAGEERLTFTVVGMNCSHCSSSVERVVGGLEGVEGFQVNLEGGQAVVRGRGLAPEIIMKSIEGLGFAATKSD
jgi:copper chaperone CopZ